jgi:ABC-type branched-subunit amino acid transport system ATPase component
MLLEIKNITKRFGGLVAVNEMSFNVAAREIVGIFGPNGSGKTTLLNVVGGLTPPTSGKILWKGQEIQGLHPHEVAGLGVVKTFQNPQLFLELTSVENVRIASHLYLKRHLKAGRFAEIIRFGRSSAEKKIRMRAEQVLEMCRLTGVRDQLAANLSYGQEKMLGVAMALMCDPDLLLLDEPASGLGEHEITNLEAVLRDLRATGMTLCIIDHKIGFLGRLADRAIALRQGQKIAEGSPNEVLNDARVIEAYLGRKHVQTA